MVLEKDIPAEIKEKAKQLYDTMMKKRDRRKKIWKEAGFATRSEYFLKAAILLYERQTQQLSEIVKIATAA
jgi:hypothetical protein